MTIGIYKLDFLRTQKVYIGQSVDIEHRFNTHLYKLGIGKASSKLQKAYDTYGTPSLDIICECSRDELNQEENNAISIWDSVENGFNTMLEAGYTSTLYGDLCGNSKYSNLDIIEVFNILVDSPSLTHADIESITGVSNAVINGISCLDTHSWLSREFPDRYKILIGHKETRRLLRRTAKSRGIIYPIVLSPEGIEYTVSSIRGFAREHGINYSSLGRVLRGQAKSHKGWVLL